MTGEYSISIESFLRIKLANYAMRMMRILREIRLKAIDLSASDYYVSFDLIELGWPLITTVQSGRAVSIQLPASSST